MEEIIHLTEDVSDVPCGKCGALELEFIEETLDVERTFVSRAHKFPKVNPVEITPEEVIDGTHERLRMKFLDYVMQNGVIR